MSFLQKNKNTEIGCNICRVKNYPILCFGYWGCYRNTVDCGRLIFGFAVRVSIKAVFGESKYIWKYSGEKIINGSARVTDSQ